MSRLQEGSFSWAIYHALELAAGNRSVGDISVLLNDPLKFYSFVTDGFGANDSFEMQALRIGCLDRGYLPILYDAARHGVTYMEAAASEAEAYLQGLLDENPIPPGMRANTQFRWDQNVASTVTCALVEGVEAYMGWQRSDTNEVDEGGGKTGPEVDKRKKYIVAIIALVVLIVLILSILIGVTVLGTKKIIYPGENTVGNQEETIGDDEASEKVDENDSVAADDKGEGKEIGETVNEVTATLSFDANGADHGSPPKNMECTKYTEIELPAADGMSKEGYVFGGWGLTKDARMVYRKGDVYDVDSDTTLYAIWDIIVEESNDFKTTELAYAADDGGYVAMVFVTNNSKRTFDLTATFDFIDAGGKTVESSVDAVSSIGPGDTTLVTKQTSKQSAKNARCRMIASRPVFGESSIAPLLKAEITRIDDNGAELTVTNTSEKPCYLTFATLYGHDNGDHFAQQTKGVDKSEQLLEPNASMVLTYEGSYWQYFTNEVYLYGYADKYE